jgi:Flp pilus assembly protein TadD
MSHLDPSYNLVLEQWQRLDQAEREVFVVEQLGRSQTPRLLHLAAETFYGDPDTALGYARQAVELSDDPDLLTHCGHLLLDLGDVDGAKRAVKAVQPLIGAGFALLNSFGHLVALMAADQGDLDRAERAMEHLFAEEPGLPGLGHDLAEVHISQGNADRAQEVVAEALHHPSDYARLEVLRAALEDLEEPGRGTTAS